MDIEHRVRERVKGVLPCDLMQDVPLGTAQDDIIPADAVTSFLTIDVIAKDYDDLVNCLRRIATLLKQKGLICLVGYQKATHYKAGNNAFWAGAHPEANVKKALKEAGFIGIIFREIVSPPNPYNDSSGCYMVTATKE